MENIDEKKLYEIQFVQLIFSLKTSAIIQLGKIANPLTGNIDRDLNEAKYTIDMLNMIKEKTKNNLTPDEEKMINDAVFELQMNYIDEVKKGEEENKEAKPEEKESKEESADQQELKEETNESKKHLKKEEKKEKEKKPKEKTKENLGKKRKNPKAKKEK
ncbi:hypothetical protein AUJ83_04925 [Candidatus Woesearchaeota archaeon CG1_02_33_12]|nr:MAG: hypothetical protein AUJ83_04925 [Candidatus Woesearchaeota archaeon CG1_02_33_12]PIN78292.1 MAG: hypothetical protein COV14_04170 [Candidatus Woesearchaeota archaeon CG10_big_fil_rev_8_21_14_0_10_33_12]PIU72660.1 MAG: DUF1844 domain-containing protein [Candidatus Woesearchaeota archaeon CG06_land_8_20_14_3_00_33_13]